MIFQTIVVGPFECNTYIVGSEEAGVVLMIDPGGEAERIMESVTQLGVTVSHIINTHGHADHTGGVAKVKDKTGAKYCIGEDDAPMLEDTFLRDMLPDFVQPPKPDVLLKGGEEFRCGDLSYTVLATPGHTLGSICIAGNDVVFTGDTLFKMSVGRSDFPGGDHDVLISSITNELMKLPKDTLVYPGHGPETSIGVEKDMNPFLRI